MKKKIVLTISIIAITTSTLCAQAFCSLRNPNSQINKFFPKNNGYKTTVGTINTKTTEHVSAITGLKLHKNEMGRHNLYIVKENSTLLGLVHSRSDLSQWGLVETVWALNIDLTIANYDFQRCRSSLKAEILKDKFKSKIVGKNIYELKKLYTDFQKEDQHKEINKLFKVMITAALKAIAVTENCWSKNINSLLKSKLETFDPKKLYIANPNNLSKQKLSLNTNLDIIDSYIIHSDNGKNILIFAPISKPSYLEFLKIKQLLCGE